MKVRLAILREYLSENFGILVEGRVEDAREKYPEMEDDNFEYLVANQPAGSNNKYLMWSCKQADALLQNDPDPQGLQIVMQAVRLFDGSKHRLQKKDLNQYTDAAEIEDAVGKLGGVSKNQQAKQARADTDTIFNDDKFMVLRPHTTEASCKYGVGTKWCIAATASHNYFSSYSESNNKFYFVIDKKAEERASTAKFAIVIKEPVDEDSTRRIQVFNAVDDQVGLNAVIKHCGEHWPAIWTKIQEHAKANPQTREVEDAQKATEEHIKTLLKGDKVSKDALERIAKDGKLTSPVIMALVKRMKEYEGPADYSDPRNGIVSALARRASELTPDGALALVKYIPTTRPPNDSFWSGRYHLSDIIKNAPLTPEAFRELSESSDDTTLSTIINNPNCPSDIIERLAKRVNELPDTELKKNVYRVLIKRGTITHEQMTTAVSRGINLSYEILNYPDMSAKLTPDLLRLVPVSGPDDLKKFLALPNVPADMAADLISKHWNQLKKKDLYELLRSVELPTEMFEKIWDGKDQHIRIAMLHNPAIGAANAAKFAASRNNAYRFAIAHNPVTPADSLQTLAGDDSASTRAGVASNLSTPAETLKALSRDEATVVRASVGSNPKSPRNVLDALKRDSDDFVRKSARKTLKTLETAETCIRLMSSMQGLITEELTDDDTPNIMIPHWSQIPTGDIKASEFVIIYLLQNNGHAVREDIQDAFQSWNPQYERNAYRQGRYGRRRTGTVKARDVWQIIHQEETQGYGNNVPARTTSAGGKGWWWSPPGINKGSLFRLTPSGAAAALDSLEKVRRRYPDQPWSEIEPPEVKTSSPVREPTPRATDSDAGNAAPRGPKTTYKIYGRFKGHLASTRLKGQAYVGAQNTQFRGGEQAYITKTDDGKLSVKKSDSDHTQTWEPIDG